MQQDERDVPKRERGRTNALKYSIYFAIYVLMVKLTGGNCLAHFINHRRCLSVDYTLESIDWSTLSSMTPFSTSHVLQNYFINFPPSCNMKHILWKYGGHRGKDVVFKMQLEYFLFITPRGKFNVDRLLFA